MGRQLGLLHDGLAVGLDSSLQCFDQGLIVALGMLLGGHQLRLALLSLAGDHGQQLHNSAGAGALLVGHLPRLWGIGLSRFRWLLPSISLHQSTLLAVELLHAGLNLLEHLDRGTSVGHRLLEEEILRLAILARLLEALLRLGYHLAQLLHIGLELCDRILEAKLLFLQVLLLLLGNLDVILVLVDLELARLMLLVLVLLLLLQLSHHLVHCLDDFGERVQLHPQCKRGQRQILVLGRDPRDALRCGAGCPAPGSLLLL
mmetsp:Transcript_82858/g.216274  ORF Transcript_82858/g.216274 Transcript_82858/m.216274 type:complete len:259 (-) Transcript_82858:1215-1991(-)